MKSQPAAKLVFLCVLAGLLLLAAIFAEQLCPYDPYAQNLREALMAPSAQHLLGTDRYGRDMLSRVLAGGRASIVSTLVCVIVVSAVGTAVGVVAGWRGGWLDTLLMRLSDVFLAFPGLVFALAVAGVLGGGIQNAVTALAAIGWPKFARIARSQTLAARGSAFIQASRMQGACGLALVVRHVLPNIAGPIVVCAVLDVGTVLMELAGLSYLGLGAQAPMAEWGSMMSDGRSMLQTAPWCVLAPGLAIFVTVLVFNLLGDTLRDYLDPEKKESER
jgi:peptide/nickel transport system permease protein